MVKYGILYVLVIGSFTALILIRGSHLCLPGCLSDMCPFSCFVAKFVRHPMHHMRQFVKDYSFLTYHIDITTDFISSPRGCNSYIDELFRGFIASCNDHLSFEHSLYIHSWTSKTLYTIRLRKKFMACVLSITRDNANPHTGAPPGELHLCTPCDHGKCGTRLNGAMTHTPDARVARV